MKSPDSSREEISDSTSLRSSGSFAQACVEEFAAPLGRQFERGLEYPVDLLESFRFHGRTQPCLQFPVQPGLGEPPVPFDRGLGDPQHLGRFLVVHAAEVAQFDDLAAAGIDLRERLQRVVERDELRRALVRHGRLAVERDVPVLAAALAGRPLARVVDEDVAHHLRGDGEEVGAVLPVHVLLPDEPQEGLVHQGGGLERMSAPLAVDVAVGEAMKRVLDQRQELAERRFIAVSPLLQQAGHERRRGRHLGHPRECMTRFPPAFR